MQHFFLAFLIFFHPLLTHELATESESIEKIILVVDKGDSLRTIAKKLSNEGIIENEIVFEFFARLSNVDRAIKSGEYYISKYQSIHEILSNLSSGSVISNKITIPEGTTSFQVVKMLNALDSLVGEISILPPEGSILPDTYFFSNGQNRLYLLRHMQESQSKKLKKTTTFRRPKVAPKILLIKPNANAFVTVSSIYPRSFMTNMATKKSVAKEIMGTKSMFCGKNSVIFGCKYEEKLTAT